MAKAIYCDCGLVCRGDSDEDLLRAAEEHLREEHPGLADRVRRQDLLAMAVEVPPSEEAAEAVEPDEPLVLRRDGSIVTLLLNRPTSRNALSLDLIERLRSALTTIAGDAAVRAVVLAATGRVFCSGHDLNAMRGADEAMARELFEADVALMRRLRRTPQPVVACVQGPATAAGCHLVAACDLAIASSKATFAVPGPVVGLVGATAMVELARLLGRHRAMQLLLSGAPVSAETALGWGLVNAVVPPEELPAAAHALASSVSSGAPETTALAKRALDDALEGSVDEAYDRAAELTWRTVPGPDAQEGISAFLDKRRPVWRPGDFRP